MGELPSGPFGCILADPPWSIRTYDAVRSLRDALTATTARLTGYDWNADPDAITKQQGDAFAAADRVFSDLDAAVAAHPDIDLPECDACNGTGKIEEPSQTEGANQHSACVRSCDECDGCGFAPDERLAPTAPVEASGSEREAVARTMLRDAFIAGRVVSTATTGSQDQRDAEAYAAERDLSSLSTTPARAEAQDEGAAGEAVARFTEGVGVPSFYEREDQLPFDVMDEAAIERWREMGREGNGHELVANRNSVRRFVALIDRIRFYQPLNRAYPSPPPAADEERVRIAVEALEGSYLRWVINEGESVEVLERVGPLLAALKSEGK